MSLYLLSTESTFPLHLYSLNVEQQAQVIFILFSKIILRSPPLNVQIFVQ